MLKDKAINNFKNLIRFNLFFSSINGLYRNYFQVKRSKFGYIDKTSRVRFPILIKGIDHEKLSIKFLVSFSLQ